MKSLTHLGCIIFFLFFFSCSKNTELRTEKHNLTGVWVLDSVYGNDFWGGRLYWRKVNYNSRILFTTDKEYYRKGPSDTAYILQGKYGILNDSVIEITIHHPPVPEYPDYTLNYAFSSGNVLQLGINAFEGIVAEKFRRPNKGE